MASAFITVSLHDNYLYQSLTNISLWLFILNKILKCLLLYKIRLLLFSGRNSFPPKSFVIQITLNNRIRFLSQSLVAVAIAIFMFVLIPLLASLSSMRTVPAILLGLLDVSEAKQILEQTNTLSRFYNWSLFRTNCIQIFTPTAVGIDCKCAFSGNVTTDRKMLKISPYIRVKYIRYA